MRTVPIYWGCTRIDDIFDTSGILVFENVHELAQVCVCLCVDVFVHLCVYACVCIL